MTRMMLAIAGGMRKLGEWAAPALFVQPSGRNRPARPWQRRCLAEQLEPRLLLTGGDPGNYARVSADWFESLDHGDLPPAEFGGDQIAAASNPAVGGSTGASDSGIHRWLVRLTPTAVEQIAQDAGAEGPVGATRRWLDGGMVAFTVLRGLGLPGMVLAETRGYRREFVEQSLENNPHVAYFSYGSTTITGQVIPNDPAFPQQWGLLNPGLPGGVNGADIDVAEAWLRTTGSSEVVVAVLDTGVDYGHPDLIGNIWRNPGEIPGNGIDDDGNGFTDDVHGFDFVHYDADPRDDNGHGTHAAGIIGAQGNNGLGIAGVNWRVSILPLKILDANNAGSPARAAVAINYATWLRVAQGVNLRVINASWGTGQYDRALYDAIATAAEAGILFVAAAGNGDGFRQPVDLDRRPFYPAGYDLDNVISVAATTPADELLPSSNYGLRSVDVAAPGMNILSTLPNGKYGTLSGTSMAAPFVSGVAALAFATGDFPTAATVRQAILASAVQRDSLQGSVASGGRVTAAGTLRYEVGVFEVNSELDGVNHAPGNGLAWDDQGRTTVRAAVQESNALPQANAIALPPGRFVLTLPETLQEDAAGGDLDVTSDLTITGAGPGLTVIDGGGLSRVFDVHPGAKLTLSGVTIAHGRDMDGGAIRNQGELVVHDCEFVENLAMVSGGAVANAAGASAEIRESQFVRNASDGLGGAIHNAGILDLGRSTLEENQSDHHGGGLYNAAGGSVVLWETRLARNGAALDGGAIGNAAEGIAQLVAVVLEGNQSGVRGGGLYSEGPLTISQSRIASNTAAVAGGGIANQGPLSLTGTTLIGNATAGHGGGVFNDQAGEASLLDALVTGNVADGGGGGFANRNGARLTIERSRVSGNASGGDGGGVLNLSGAVVSLIESTLDANEAEDGGGLSNQGAGTSAGIERTTLSGNTATRDGGAVHQAEEAELDIVNSTLSANAASRGGGMVMAGGIAELLHVTIAGNTAGRTGGVAADAGAMFVRSTLVAANHAADSAPDVSGTFLSRGHNLVGTADGATGFEYSVNGDQAGTGSAPLDPRLGPLADNGGFAATHALLPNSPAIDRAQAGELPAIDQRGQPRNQFGDASLSLAADIGAYEYRVSAIPLIPHRNGNGIIPNVAIQGPGQIDLFEVTWRSAHAGAGARIGTTGTADTTVSVYDDAGTRIARDEDSGPDANGQVLIPVQGNRTYYVVVEIVADAGGAYNLEMTGPNQVITADIHTPPGAFVGSAADATSADDRLDFFELRGPANASQLTVQVQSTDEFGAWVRVADGNNQVLAIADTTSPGWENVLRGLPVASGGIYHVTVFNATLGAAQYTVTADFDPDETGLPDTIVVYPPPAYRPLIPLTYGGYSLSGLVVARPAQFDYYLFCPSVAGEYELRTRGTLDTQMAVYHGSGAVKLAESGDDGPDGNARIARAFSVGERYWVVVRGAGDNTGSYDLELIGPEQRITPVSIAGLSRTGEATASLSNSTRQQHFSVVAPVGTNTLSLSVSNWSTLPSHQTDSWLAIQNPAGAVTVVDAVGEGQTEHLMGYPVVAGQTYRITVYGTWSNGVSSLRLNLDFDPNAGGSDEIPVTTSTIGNQRTPSVAMNAAGESVVVWTGEGLGTTYDTWDDDVFLQRFDAQGQAAGIQTKANLDDGDVYQADSAVGMDSGGNFVISWLAQDQTYFRRFTAAGVPRDGTGGETSVGFPGNYFNDIAVQADGSFLVLGGDWRSLYARLYDSAGNPLGGYRSLDSTLDEKNYRSVAVDGNGNYIVAWTSISDDSRSVDVYVLRLDGAGNILPSGRNDYVPGRVTGTWFEDANQNGVQDAGEPGLANVALFLDANGNGVRDGGEPQSNTGADGDYVFTNVGVGVHRILPIGGGSGGPENVGDDFNRSDSTDMGPAWVESSGDFRVEGNLARAAHGAYAAMTYQDFSGYDQLVTFDLHHNNKLGDWDDRGAYADVYLARADASHYVSVRVADNDYNDGIAKFNRLYFGHGQTLYGRTWARMKLKNESDYYIDPTPFNSARILAAYDSHAHTLVVGIDANFDGLYEELFHAGGVPADGLGHQVAVGAYNNVAIDNFTVHGSMAIVPDTAVLPGEEFRVAPEQTAKQWNPQVAANDSGQFVVVWQGQDTDGTGDNVYARAFDSDGWASSDVVRTHEEPAGSQQYPSVAVTDSGDFLVVWESTMDGGMIDLVRRRFDPHGSPLLSEDGKPLHRATYNRLRPALSTDGYNTFQLVWRTAALNGVELGLFGSSWQMPSLAYIRATTELASVTGKLYRDADDRGNTAEAMSGLAGWQIFADLNRNGIWDAGEPETTTLEDDPQTPDVNERGLYRLDGIPPGRQLLLAVPPDADAAGGRRAWQPTFPAQVLFLGPSLPLSPQDGTLVTADFDRNGNPDLAAVGYTDNTLTVWLQEPDGTFQDSSQSIGPGSSGTVGLVAIDVNRDHYDDLLVVSQNTGELAVLINQGDGTFALEQTPDLGYSAVALATGQFNDDNQDGRIDDGDDADAVVLVVGAQRTQQAGGLWVLLNDGQGRFTPLPVPHPVGLMPQFLLVEDLDGDGFQDVAVANMGTAENGGGVSILWGTGGGSFLPQVALLPGTRPVALAAADLDGDGDLDLAVADRAAQAIVIIENRGARTWHPHSPHSIGVPITSVLAADFDQDGDMDLAAVHLAGGLVSVLWNQGQGDFGEPQLIGGGELAWTVIPRVVVQDLNADRRVDLAASDPGNGRLHLLYNRPGGWELMLDGGATRQGVDFGVYPLNLAPTFNVISMHRIAVNQGPQEVPDFAYQISAGPDDEADQSVVFELVSNSNPALFAVAPWIDASGTLRYTPVADADGTAVVTVQLRDDGGVAHGGQDVGPPKSFVIQIAMQGTSDWQNPSDTDDVDASGLVTPLDALLVINQLNLRGSRPLPGLIGTPLDHGELFYDTDGDGYVTPADVLRVVNRLNAAHRLGGEGEIGIPAAVSRPFDAALDSTPGEKRSGAWDWGLIPAIEKIAMTSVREENLPYGIESVSRSRPGQSSGDIFELDADFEALLEDLVRAVACLA